MGLSDSIMSPRTTAALFGVFAALALLTATAAIGGIMALTGLVKSLLFQVAPTELRLGVWYGHEHCPLARTGLPQAGSLALSVFFRLT